MAYKLRRTAKVKIDEFTFTVGMMTLEQKSLLESFTKTNGGKEVIDAAKVAYHYVRCCVKGVTGIINEDDSPYEVEFESDGQNLTKRCIEDLSNLPCTNDLFEVLSQFATGIKDRVVDPDTGKPLAGVKVILPKKKKQSTKTKA
jgi:hypothetical protein